ncbi:hypothetical protein ABD74_16310 [Brevibacillus laterosporus]|nr:hypothetical protein [Brevibacillus laterosporus]
MQNKYSVFIFFVSISLFIKLTSLVDSLVDNIYLASVIELLLILVLIALLDTFLTNWVRRLCEKFNIKLPYLYGIYIVLYLIVFRIV